MIYPLNRHRQSNGNRIDLKILQATGTFCPGRFFFYVLGITFLFALLNVKQEIKGR